jgi:hypothetical protein
VRTYIKLVVISVLAILYAVAGWAVGLVVLAAALALLVRKLLVTRRALAPTTRCPWCRAEVPQYGAYACGNCHTRTLGWVWRCPTCAAWAGHTTCPECSMSIVNPLLPRP